MNFQIVWCVWLVSLFAVRGEVVRVRVTDDDARPIAGADVRVIFGGTLSDGSRDATVQFKTDNSGAGFARGNAEFTTTVFVSKPGFYDLRLDRLRAGQDHELSLIMRERKTPIPLHVVRFGLQRPEPFPKHGEWLGFDLAAADWIEPYGRGKVEDLRFKFSTSFHGWKTTESELIQIRKVNATVAEDELRLIYGKWDAVCEIAFPGGKQGLIEETLRFLGYSALKMPHQAPAAGYLTSWRVETKSYGPPVRRENVGFFLRTRVRLDERGNIVSANYAKINGDIQVDARGSISFHYYFNPVANSRNLEFDTERNLFPDGLVGTVNMPTSP